jgi:hypothetical protein
VETTNPINGNDLEAVTENLILETPSNSDDASEEAVAVTEDTQPEAVEIEAQDQDDDVSYDDTDTYDEDVEVEEPEVEIRADTFMVKVDGEEREVSLDELTRGYSGQKYIQKGMADNAETKKQLDQVTQQVAQERQMLQHLINQAQQGAIPVVPEYPSEELKDSDPLGFQLQAEEYRRAVEQRQQWEQQVSYVTQQQRAHEEQQHNQYLEQQAQRLSEWMPEFADPEKRTVFIQEMSSKAKKHYDLTDEQIGTVKTAEEVMILNDALKWRELQANKSNAQKKAEGARPVVKPAAKRAANAGKASKAKKASQAMKRSGSIDDIANWLTS